MFEVLSSGLETKEEVFHKIVQGVRYNASLIPYVKHGCGVIRVGYPSRFETDVSSVSRPSKGRKIPDCLFEDFAFPWTNCPRLAVLRHGLPTLKVGAHV